MYPVVSLEDFRLDVELARRLPRQLAYYHLALPVGVDEDGITVAMAQPDNQKAREIIERSLGRAIIPVHSDSGQIRRLLDQLWQAAPSPVIPSFEVAIAAEAAASGDLVVAHYARQFATLYGGEPVPQPDDHPDTLLVVRRLADPLNFHFSGSTLLVNRLVQPIHRVLHLVRMHPPDQRVLASLIPLLKSADIELTLLPDTGVVAYNLAGLIDGSTPAGQHLEKLRQQLEEHTIVGRLRLKQGPFSEAIETELAGQAYDLVALAADAFGETVENLIRIISTHQVAVIMVIGAPGVGGKRQIGSQPCP